MTNAKNPSDTSVVFDALFRQCYPSLCLYAYKLLQDYPAAEDVVQNCFVKAWINRDALSLSAPLLYTAVKNASIDYLRRSKKMSPVAIDGTDDSFLSRMMYAETMSEIFSHFKHLPDQCRTIFDRLYVHGDSIADVAGSLQVSPSTIRTQKSRGMAMLRKNLRGMLRFFF